MLLSKLRFKERVVTEKLPLIERVVTEKSIR